MTRLTRLALNHPSITFLLMAALVVGGLFAAFDLNQELVPDVQPPQATIVVVYPGASADEVTRSVVEPIEDAMDEITDVDVLEVSANATEAFAAITVLSEFGTGQEEIESAIEEQLEDVELPEDAEQPEIILFNFADLPVLQASVSGEIEERELQALLEDQVVPELEKISGVSEVTLTGSRDDKIFLRLDADALEERGVSVSQIRNVLTANDLTFPAGRLESAGRVTPVQVTNRIGDAEALSQLIVSTGEEGSRGGPPGSADGGGPPEAAGPSSRSQTNRQAAAPADVPEPPYELPVEVRAIALSIRQDIATTDDLTPELVDELEASSPELLRDAGEAIVDALPPGGFAQLPADVLAALPGELRADLRQRAARNAAAETEGEQEQAADDAATEDEEGDSAAADGDSGSRVRVIVVQPGENVGSLAARFGVSASTIRSENDLEEDAELEAGTVVRIPEAGADELPLIWQLADAESAEDITPEIFDTILAASPSAVNALTAAQLRALPAATIERLPTSFLARQDPDLLEDLVRRRDSAADAADEDEDDEAGASQEQAEAEDDADDESETAAVQEIPDDWVRLGDVADVVVGPEDADTINRTNGATSLGLLVLKDRSANTVSVVRDVEDKLDELQDDIPAFDALEVRTIFEQASFIEESLSGVRNEGLLGGVFAVVVILIFLSSVRSTLIIAISIPLSIITALLLMRLQGLTLNLLTLSGLTIAIGRVVDDSIVVLENIYRNLQKGTRRRDAIIQGTKEVAAAITAATLVTVAVFLPLGYIGGLTRQFFLPFALTTAYALLASLLVAVTVIPLLSRTFLNRDRLPEEQESWLQRIYTPSLEWALDHRWTTLILSALLFLLSLGLARFIPQNFIGGFGDPAVTIDLSMPSGTSLETTDAVARLVEEVIRDEEDLEDVETTVGRGSTFFGEFAGGDPSKAFFFVNFAGDDEDESFIDQLTGGDDEIDEPDEVAKRVREDLATLDDLDVIAERLPSLIGRDEAERVVEDLRGVLAEERLGNGDTGGVFDAVVSAGSTGGPPSGVFDLRVAGEDEAQVREATDLILTALRDPERWEDLDYDLEDEDDTDDEDEDDEGFFEGLFGDDDDDDDEEDDQDTDGEIALDDLPIINLDSNLTDARRVLTVDVDPALALEQGLTTAQVAFALRPVLEGNELGKLELQQGDDLDRLEVVATFPNDTITDRASLESFELDTPGGETVRLGDIATIELRDGAVQITRVDGERASIITGEILDDDVFGIQSNALSIIDDLREDREDLFGEIDVDPEDEDYEEPPVTVGAGVESSQQRDGFRDLLLALPVSILIVYLILVIEFGSLAIPFVILFSLPFAVSGALIGLAVTGRSLSISSMIGVLMLIGIVVTNAIVLLDFVQQLRERGYDTRTALVEGGRIRVRPIIMTAIATVIALIPLALGFTEGAIIATELATTVIGGLITSTLLTLVVVPVVYSLISGVMDRDFFEDEDEGPDGGPDGGPDDLPPAPATPPGGQPPSGGGTAPDAPDPNLSAPEVPSVPPASTPAKPAPDPFAPPSSGTTPPQPAAPPSRRSGGSLGTWQSGPESTGGAAEAERDQPGAGG